MSDWRFWAKTTPDGLPGISVFEHMLNVGCVARCLAEVAPELLHRFHWEAGRIGTLAALHDLGKISPGFQGKCIAWLEGHGLSQIARNHRWDALETNHAAVTHAAVQRFLVEAGMPRKSASCIAALLGAHHGTIQGPADSRPFVREGISESSSGIDWERERASAAAAVQAAFSTDLTESTLTIESPCLWWLAGLTTVADWIGSDERRFPAEGGLDEPTRSQHARQAIEDIGFAIPAIVPNLAFADLFGFPAGSRPNDMQVQARKAIQGPGVYVIEAPMGMGKTEAALWVAYELLCAGKARGIYFALPTQATSNRIHLRMSEFVRRISPASPASRLIHGNSWLMQSQVDVLPAATMRDRFEDARVGEDWFASAKRTLLAPFGVGTVDQALLGVVAAKHFFVRRFALAGKVVILDEVHSYDLYTGTLIDCLVKTLADLGCTTVILSATLTGKRRGQIVDSELDLAVDPAEQPYPLISGCQEAGGAIAMSARPPDEKNVQVSFQQHDTAKDRAIQVACAGGVVLWICDTVGSAQEQYKSLLREARSRFLVGLLHSRYPFWRREQLEEEWMNRLGKAGATRCGCILIATQIVEQSVDLDADLLITELAPTDMLFQRLGRLWRHNRPERHGRPEMIVLEESESLDRLREMKAKDVVKALGPKASVYSPYVLLRSLEVWKAGGEVVLPAQIRARIEATYEDRFEGEEPASWQALFQEMLGESFAHRNKALRSSNIWTVQLDDEEGVQTRLDEQPTLPLVLVKSLENTIVRFLDGTSEPLQEKRFKLSLAQKIHRNLVRIPARLLEQAKSSGAFDDYLHGGYAVGRVADGIIEVGGLKQSARLAWSEDEGVIIEENAARSRE